MDEQKCSLNSIRMDVQVYGSAPVDENGHADDDMAIESVMENVREWQPCNDDPYYCQWCDGYWKTWEEAKRHLNAVRGPDGRPVKVVIEGEGQQ